MSCRRQIHRFFDMRREKRLPEVGVMRLSLYARELARWEREGRNFISSAALGEALGFSAAQIRRDLSVCGQFGTSGRGYEVHRLHEQLMAILGLAGRTWRVALAGVGNLGSALLAYRGFRERGFAFHLAFDADAAKMGRLVHGVRIEAIQQLTPSVQREAIDIGVIAVPVDQAADVCAAFVRGKVSGIVNFAPLRLTAPAHVTIRHVDLSMEFEQLTYHLSLDHAEHCTR